MKQGKLFDGDSTQFVEGLTCAFGEPWWTGPHPLCQQEADRLCAEFDAGVLAGKWDAQGYTPNERKAQQRKKL